MGHGVNGVILHWLNVLKIKRFTQELHFKVSPEQMGANLKHTASKDDKVEGKGSDKGKDAINAVNWKLTVENILQMQCRLICAYNTNAQNSQSKSACIFTSQVVICFCSQTVKPLYWTYSQI